MSLKNVVLVGASGNLGPAIVNELLAAGVNVTATSRPDSTSTYPDGVKVARTDYSLDSLVDIFKGQDAVLSFFGGENLTKQNVLIDAAAKAGVKRFFPSEYGSDTRDPHSQELMPIFKDKVAAVKYAESKGLTYTAVVSGPFFDWGLAKNFLGPNLKEKTFQLWDSGNTKFSSTNTSTIGKALAAILTKPELVEATKNEYINIHSHTISQNELLAAVEEVSGEKWKVEPTNAKEVEKKALAEVKGGNPYAVYDLIKAHAFGDGAQSDNSKLPGGLWNDKLGLPKEDLKADLKKALAA